MPDTDASNEVTFGDPPEKALSWLEDHLQDPGDKIQVISGWCKRCGICVSFCPVKALTRDKEGFPRVDNKKCISCGTCEIMCPDFAIVVSNLKEKTKKE